MQKSEIAHVIAILKDAAHVLQRQVPIPMHGPTHVRVSANFVPSLGSDNSCLEMTPAAAGAIWPPGTRAIVSVEGRLKGAGTEACGTRNLIFRKFALANCANAYRDFKRLHAESAGCPWT